MSKIIFYPFFFICCVQCNRLMAQSSLSFQCKELNLDKTTLLNCDPVEEDDPDDLDEAYGHIRAFMGKSSDDLIDITFPTKIKSWRWTQKDENDKNDSLYAYLSYNTNPKVYGYTLQAYAKDFTITVTRYDNKKGGIIEGTFHGTMQADLAWLQQTVTIAVKGNFKTTRSGVAPFNVRKQRLAEKPVISKSVKVLQDALLQPVQNAGWRIDQEENAFNSAVSTTSALPITIDLFHLKLTLDPNTAYGKMIYDSAKYYNERLSNNAPGSKAFKQAAGNFFRVQNMLTAEIVIESNRPLLKTAAYTISGKSKYSVLHIPGTSYACRVYIVRDDAEEINQPEEITSLFFGNWKGADMHSEAIVKYPFIHQKGPYIENLVVTITAPAAAADRIIQSIDWDKLNDAITK